MIKKNKPFGNSKFDEFQITDEQAQEVKGGKIAHELADVDMSGVSAEVCRSTKAYTYSESGGFYTCRDANGTVVGAGKI